VKKESEKRKRAGVNAENLFFIQEKRPGIMITDMKEDSAIIEARKKSFQQ